MKTIHRFFSLSIIAICLALTGPAIATTDFTARTALTTIPNADPFASLVTGVSKGGELNLSSNVIVLDSQDDFENLRRQQDGEQQGNVLHLEAASLTLEEYTDLIMTNGTVRVWTEGGEIKAEAVDIYKQSSIQGSGGDPSRIPAGVYKLDRKPELLKLYRGFYIWQNNLPA
jgi:hypothetical protein